MSSMHLLCILAKLSNLELKTRSKQLLGYLPFDPVLRPPPINSPNLQPLNDLRIFSSFSYSGKVWAFSFWQAYLQKIMEEN